MEKWYTRPDDSFASFYYYDRASRIMVRIRLELGRTPTDVDTGDTCVIYHRHRYVGFSSRIYSETERRQFRLDEFDGSILDHKGNRMRSSSSRDNYVYDFSSNGEGAPIGLVHKGNAVVNKEWAPLPGRIGESDLIRLAELCLRRKTSITLTGPGATEDQLEIRIRELIGAPVMPPKGGGRRCTIC